jgi:hypothetical protein
MGLTVLEMLRVIALCGELVQDGPLDSVMAETCSSTYEDLKDRVAGGDYLKFRRWYRDNRDRTGFDASDINNLSRYDDYYFLQLVISGYYPQP